MNKEVKIIEPATQQAEDKKTPGKLLLIIALVCFVYIFIPEPTDLIPGIGWLDEVLAGGISLTALLTYLVRYIIFKKAKQHFTGKK